MDSRLKKLAREQSALCHVFGNAYRVLIAWTLANQEMPVSLIADAIEASLQNTSQHLRLMEDKGILKSRREGNTVYYRITRDGFVKKCPLLLQAVQPAPDPYSDKETTMYTPELSEIQSAKVVDARGSACPGPLLEAKKGIGQVRVGEILEIWSGDANTKNDLPRWCQKVGHEFLGIQKADGYERLFIRRAR